ncbi:MAG: hypothetical protein H0W86_03165 [Armatimonadetes bacterium]|nr:hypothetical protein [Armatimonadota bacterium]
MNYAIFLVVTLVAAPTSALADTAGEHRAAHMAVRALVRDNAGAGAFVGIVETKSAFLSTSESRITGRGYFSRSGGWSATDFTYSVKVRRLNYEARDAVVTLANGNRWESDTDWGKPPTGGFVGHFTKPVPLSNVDSASVRFEGVGTVPMVELRIFDRTNKMIRQRRVEVKNGKWSATEKLSKGVYRAVLGLARMADSDEVRFSVSTSGPDWGLPGDRRVSITYPKNGADLHTLRADIQGTSTSTSIALTVFRRDGGAVSKQTLRVVNGRWSTSLGLAPGRYRAIAAGSGGGGFDQVSFSYSKGSSGEKRAAITYPKNGAAVNTSRAAIQGTSTEKSVELVVYNSKGAAVARRSIGVERGRWSVSLKLDPGAYRVVASSVSGGDVDEVQFHYNTSSQEARVKITSPANGVGVKGSPVRIRGTSTEYDVILDVYDSGGNHVARQSLSVLNGRWDTTVALEKGKFRVVARSGSGKDTDEISFRRT